MLPVYFVAKLERTELAKTLDGTVSEASIERSPVHVKYFLLSCLGSNPSSTFSAVYNIIYFYKFMKRTKSFRVLHFMGGT